MLSKKKYNETWFKTFWNLCIFVTFAEFAAWENERGKVNIFAIWNMRSLIFLILGRFHQWSLYFRMFGKGLQLKTTALLVFFLWLVKSEKLVNNRIVDHIEKCCLFSDFSLVLGLLDQLQIFSELYLIELLGLLTGLGYSSCGTWFIQGFWHGLTCWSFSETLSLMEFQVRYLVLFLLFSVIDGFK